MKSACVTLVALCSFCWAAEEVRSYEEARARVGEDGWVLLCYGADWDRIYDEKWMRRQASIRTACGNALMMYVPVWQNPNEEQRQQTEAQLRGIELGERPYPTLPCAILLDAQGHPYKVVSGEEFRTNVAGVIRNAQAQLRTRCELLRQAELETGVVRAQTLGRIWRLSIAPPPGLRAMMAQADPEDAANIASISPFDVWAFAQHVHALPWEQAKAELERMQKMPLSNEEKQALLAIRMGCVHFFLQAAAAREVKELSAAINALGVSTPLAKASVRAARNWGTGLSLATGWRHGQLPRVKAPCEFEGAYYLSKPGSYRLTFNAGEGNDIVRVCAVSLYDGERLVAQDEHPCEIKYGEATIGNEYTLRVENELMNPRVKITFDQRNGIDTSGGITVQYGSLDGMDFSKLDIRADSGLLSDVESARKPAAGQGDAVKESYITLPGGVSVGTLKPENKDEEPAAEQSAKEQPDLPSAWQENRSVAPPTLDSLEAGDMPRR